MNRGKSQLRIAQSFHQRDNALQTKLRTEPPQPRKTRKDLLTKCRFHRSGLAWLLGYREALRLTVTGCTKVISG